MPLSSGQTLIGCKWLYKIKYNPDGIIERNKSRLFALGCKQVYGVNFEETFAHVAKMSKVRALLVVVAMQDWFTV